MVATPADRIRQEISICKDMIDEYNRSILYQRGLIEAYTTAISIIEMGETN